MGFIRNLVLLSVGYVAYRVIKGAMTNAEAQKAKVRATADDKPQGVTRLKLDPNTGVYTPEA